MTRTYTHTYTYLHKTPRKIELATCNHQADSPPNVWSSDLHVERVFCISHDYYSGALSFLMYHS